MKEPLEEYKPIEKLELKGIKKEFPKVFKKVNCPSCEKEVTAENLNLQNSVAKCGSCNVIFSIEQEVEKVKSKTGMKQETLRPEGIDLFFYNDDLEITVQPHIQGIDAYGIVLLPILAIIAIAIFYITEKSIHPYIPLAFSMGALYFIYRGLNYSKNKTYIDINDKSLSIKSRPKNLKKDKSYATGDIDQLYIRYSSDGTGHYTIHMVTNAVEGQKHTKLITVNTLTKAKYLEQEIERYLNIENRKVIEAHF